MGAAPFLRAKQNGIRLRMPFRARLEEKNYFFSSSFLAFLAAGFLAGFSAFFSAFFSSLASFGASASGFLAYLALGTKSTHSRMHISLLSLMRLPSLTMRV